MLSQLLLTFSKRGHHHTNRCGGLRGDQRLFLVDLELVLDQMVYPLILLAELLHEGWIGRTHCAYNSFERGDLDAQCAYKAAQLMSLIFEVTCFAGQVFWTVLGGVAE